MTQVVRQADARVVERVNEPTTRQMTADGVGVDRTFRTATALRWSGRLHRSMDADVKPLAR